MVNGAIFKESDSKDTPSDMLGLIKAVASNTGVVSKEMLRWRNTAVPTDPTVNDLRSFAGNLGAIVPAGFLMIHNDLQALLSGSSETGKGESTGGDLWSGLLGGAVMGAATSGIMMSLNVGANTLTADLPESFSKWLAIASLDKYFDDAGFIMSYDMDGEIVGMERKPYSEEGEWRKTLTDSLELGLDAVAILRNKTATAIQGVGAALGNAIEDTFTSLKFASLMVDAEIPPQFGNLMAMVSLTKYFDEAGYEAVLNGDGEIVSLKLKDSVPDKAWDWVTTVVDKYVEVTAILGSSFASAVQGTGAALANSIEDVSTSIKFADLVVNAEIPPQFGNLMAMVSLTKYFRDAGYDIEINGDGEITRFGVQTGTVDKVMKIVNEATDLIVDTASILMNPFAMFIQGTGAALGSAIENVSTSMKFADLVVNAEIPPQFASLLAQVSMAQYFQEAGYNVTLSSTGELESIEPIQKSFAAKVGDGVKSLFKWVGDLASTGVEAIADTTAGLALDKRVLDLTVDAMDRTLKEALVLSSDQTADIRSQYKDTLDGYFAKVGSVLKGNNGRLSDGNGLAQKMNDAYLAAMKDSLENSVSLETNQTISSTFNDSRLYDAVQNLNNKVGMLLQQVDAIVQQGPPTVVNMAGSAPTPTVSYDSLP